MLAQLRLAGTQGVEANCAHDIRISPPIVGFDQIVDRVQHLLDRPDAVQLLVKPQSRPSVFDVIEIGLPARPWELHLQVNCITSSDPDEKNSLD